MPPIAWAASGGIKIERAKEHIGYLETAIAAFRQLHPYRALVEDDPETGEWVFRATIDQDPPLRWGAIAGDAIHNLRSALDILWRAVWPVNVRDENRRDNFPIRPSANDFEGRFRGPKEPARQTVVDILKATKPYQGGNDLLWRLERLDAEDKHHILLPVGVAVPSMAVQYIAPPWLPGRPISPRFGMLNQMREIRPPPPIRMVRAFAVPVYPVHDGTELYRVPINPEGPQVDMDPQFSFEIALGETEASEGQAIVPTLHQLAGVVDGVVETFFRAGLLR